MLLFLLLLLSVVQSYAADCTFHVCPPTQNANNEITVEFSCIASWETYVFDLYLNKDVSGIDPSVKMGSVTIVTGDVHIVRTYAIPSSLQNCDYDELYFYISSSYLLVTYPFESCRFLPKGICADWTCGAAFYGVGDGCDCGCGAHDRDCDIPLATTYCSGVADDSSVCSAVTDTCVPKADPLPTVGNCIFYTENYPTDKDYCRFTQHADETLLLKFACGANFDNVDVNLQGAISWGFDDTVTHVNLNIEKDVMYEFNVTIPTSFQSCTPETLSFYLDVVGFNNFESCHFKPEKGLEMNPRSQCGNVITAPVAAASVPMITSMIRWDIAGSDGTPTNADNYWSGYNMQFYLYRDVPSWFDPYWMVNEGLATARSIAMTPNDVGIQTHEASNWYIAAYYRTSILGWASWSNLVMESGRFVLQDDSKNAWVDFTICGGRYSAKTCQSVDGGVANDFCRFAAGDFTADMLDLSLEMTDPATCSTTLTAKGNFVGTFWYFDSALSSMKDVVVSKPVEFTKILNLTDLATHAFTVKSVDVGTLIMGGNPSLSALGIGGTVDINIASQCVGGKINAKLLLGGAVTVIGKEIVGKEVTMYEQSVDLSPASLDAPCTVVPDSGLTPDSASSVHTNVLAMLVAALFAAVFQQ